MNNIFTTYVNRSKSLIKLTTINVFLLLAVIIFSTNFELIGQSISDYKPGEKIPKPVSRYHYYMQQRAYPFENIPDRAVVNSFEEKDIMSYKLSKNSNYTQSLHNEWRLVGPSNIGGRVKSIAIHPDNDNIVYIGAAAGGVWKTTDGGNTWKALLDKANSIAFGSISIDEQNPEVIYVGTGEAVSGGGNIYAGNGILKSENGGESWKQIGLTTIGAFSKVFCHPLNSKLIIAGGFGRSGGLYISEDAGITWKRTVEGSITDVSINERDENEMLCAINGADILISNDKGKSWNSIKKGDLANNNLGRISVQFSKVASNVIYTLCEMGPDRIGKVYKSINKGQTWFLVHDGKTEFFGSNSQGFYDNYIETHPTDVNRVLAGGIDTWLTVNGAQFLNQTNGYTGGNVHVDQHCAAFSRKNPNIVYIGNDGGVYRSTNGGLLWTDKNLGLPITQFYGLGIDNKQANKNVGGTQDNGTLGDLLGGDWSLLLGGDGFQVVVDSEKKFFYGESQYGNISKISYGTGQLTRQSFTQGLTPAVSGNSLFDSPLIGDPNNSSYIWHGRKSIYLNYGSGSWYEFPQTKITNFYSAIGVSHGKEELIYAGTNNGEVYVSQNGVDAPFISVQGNGLVNRFVSSIKTSFVDPKVAYITYSGYGTPHIFKTADEGRSWVNISGNLPNTPINEIEIDPDYPTHIYAATDAGVFATYDEGLNWFPFGRALPNSPSIALEFHNNLSVINNKILRVATHGRSIWEIDIPAENVTEHTIVKPIGGESFIAGTNSLVSWYGFTQPIKIEYSTDNGDTWSKIIEDELSGNTLYWNVANRPTFTARIKITSIANPTQVAISNTFTIEQKKIGSLLSENTINTVPYGIDIDSKGNLWATDFNGGKLIYLDPNNFQILNSFKLKADSLYTDITIDENNNRLFVHRLNSTAGGGGVIESYSLDGNFLNSYKSPALSYPIGLEIINNILYVGDRDDQRLVRAVNPENGSVFQTYKSPCDVNFGPRGVDYDGQYFLQICTNFSSGSLSDAKLMRLDLSSLTVEKDNVALEGYSGVINARGITFDKSDKNFWISDFGGNIYKIAGFETITSVENDDKMNQTNDDIFSLELYPNPANNYININYKANRDSDVKLFLSDNFGNNVGIVFENYMLENSIKNVVYDIANLSSGMYYLNVQVGSGIVSTKQIVVIK